MNDIREGLARIAAAPDGRGVLVEITATSGSAPRTAGARMLLGPDGSFSGTIGGGGLEYRAQAEARRLLAAGGSVRKTYSLGAAPGEATGAICGGSADVVFRSIGPAEAAELLAQAPARPRVLLFGAGHVGKALADVLALMDLPVTVTDPRPELLTEARFPRAERRAVPEAEMTVDAAADDLVVILTHSHVLDYTLLRLAMASPARYIGMIGSQRKSELFRSRLAQDGFPPDGIEARLRTPIGVPIGAQTPEEIAVSIAAELIAELHR